MMMASAPGTHQDQACCYEHDDCQAWQSHSIYILTQALVRKRTPEKTSVPCHVQVIVFKILGSFGPACKSSWQRQIEKNTH